MIKNLRKRHLQVWLVWACLLPAGILFAWFSVPEQPVQALLQSDVIKPLPFEIQRQDKKNYTVIVLANKEHSRYQLQWINKNILEQPTATIYLSGTHASNINDAKLVGRIEARGIYTFPLDSAITDPNSIRQFIVYDFIHQQIIDTVNF